MSINATGIIFSNMHDEEMHEITACRTMGSLPFGGRYRLVDFALSNMHNSDITEIAVIAKSNYQSLIDHLGSGKEWDLSRKMGGLFIFPPFSRSHTGFYKNKIEALFGVLEYIRKSTNDYIIITDCDVICNMDFTEPLKYHIEKEADITALYYKVVPKKPHSGAETVYEVNSDGIIIDLLLNQRIDEVSNVGTNMYIIGKNLLINLIEDAVAHNLESFERDILQKKIGLYKMAAWCFDGYVGKINSINDFFSVNMDILNKTVRDDLFYRYGNIYTKVLDDVPTRYGSCASVSNSMIADGCIIEGLVENSILFSGVKVSKDSRIHNSILMKNCMVGENVELAYVLADKGVIFNDNRKLIGCDPHPIYISKESNI